MDVLQAGRNGLVSLLVNKFKAKGLPEAANELAEMIRLAEVSALGTVQGCAADYESTLELVSFQALDLWIAAEKITGAEAHHQTQRAAPRST